jgi:hypothetical protein
MAYLLAVLCGMLIGAALTLVWHEQVSGEARRLRTQVKQARNEAKERLKSEIEHL